jgi:uncharacterized protein (TIGR03382 family)
MARRAALLLLLLPGAALAQTTATAVISNPTRLSRADCAQTSGVTTVTWSWTPTGQSVVSGDLYRFAAYAPGSACPSSAPIAGSTSIVANDLAATVTLATQTINIGRIINAVSPGCTSAIDQLVNICVYYVPVTAAQVQVLWQGVLNFQTALPPRPTVNGVTPGDGQLTTTVLAGTPDATYAAVDGITYYVYCTDPSGNVTTAGPGNASANIVCGGLVNGTTYSVTAAGVSAAGNLGPVSSPAVQATPLPFQDFWNLYKSDGGQEQGGCGTAGAGVLAPVAAALALLALRRRRS